MLLRDLTNEALFSWNSGEAVVFCPRCKSTDVKDSLYRVNDVLALLVGFKPLRCRCCLHRFRVWRLFGEDIREQPEPGTEMVLVRTPIPPFVGRNALLAAAAQPAPQQALPLPQGFESPGLDLSGSLMNLFNATNQFGGAGFATPTVRGRIVEAEFSASLASAAVAVGHSLASQSESVNSRQGIRPPAGPENRRKGDRPRMHMAARPYVPRKQASSEEMLQPVRP